MRSQLVLPQRPPRARPQVQTMLKTGVRVGSVEHVEMLFSFIAPLVAGVEGEEELDEEVRRRA